MGGGKTAVITPIVLAAAARGEKMVRATVLSSLYATNSSDWQMKIGGILGRRVFPFLCSRDMPLSFRHAKVHLETLKKIRREGHVIVTVSEHRLSLENKAIVLATPSVSNVSDKDKSKTTGTGTAAGTANSSESDKPKTGDEMFDNRPSAANLAASEKLHEALEFIRLYGRDFLDESDEILSPRFQLIYTLGSR